MSATKQVNEKPGQDPITIKGILKNNFSGFFQSDKTAATKEEVLQMKVFKNINTWTIATLQKIGTMFLVTIGRIKKLFDNEQTAITYINNLGYQF